MKWTFAVDEGLIEIGRKAIEDVAIEYRDSRIGVLGCGNGIVCREKDGTPSDIIRIPTCDAVRIALRAIAQHLENAK